MRKIKEQEKEGIELTIEEEVQVGENVLEEGDKVIVYPVNNESSENETEEKEDKE